jgi:PAS domain S-box-containing protein
MIADELLLLARGLGQFGAESGFVHMLASLVMAANEFIGIADLEGNTLYVNEAGRKLVGLRDLEAVHSTRILDYFAPEDHPTIMQVVMLSVRSTGFWEGELRFRNFATGELIPVLYSIFPVRDPSGTVTAYGTVTRNLTETKLAEQRLLALASIVESSDDAIVSKDLDGTIRSWNQGAERVFGYAAEEAIGRPITIVIPEERHDEERDILARISSGQRIDHFETVRQRKDGRLIDISLTVSPVKNTDGKIVGASKIARDITERKRNQEHIATLAREAEHRSKNLLSIVQAIVRISQSDTTDGLKRVIDGRVSALASVHSLFAETRWRGADLKTIATRELAPFSQADERRVRIEGPPVLLKPDAAQAAAIAVHELATNAAKYGALSAPGGAVALEWSQEADSSLKLRWTETGGPAVRKPARRGFGSRVIEEMIRQLNGEMHFDWRREGLVCEITLQA